MPRIRKRRNATRKYRVKRRGKRTSTKTQSNKHLANATTVSTTHKSRLSVRSMPSIMPDAVKIPFKYRQKITLTATTGAISTQTFRNNSLYDPDYSGAGTQPMGFDQWALMYNQYRVFANKYSLMVYNSSASVPIQVCVTGDNEAAPAASDILTVGEQPQSSKILTITSSGSRKAQMQGYLKNNTVVGQTAKEYAVDELTSALVTASPSQSNFMHIHAQALDGVSTATATVSCEFTLYATLFDKKELGGS